MAILNELLEQLNLSEKETKVYLASLELGSSIVSSIAKQADINRGTTYDILRSLTRKGLAHYYEKGRIAYFTALEPEKLVGYTEKQIKQWQDNKKRIEEHLPELKAIYRSSEEKPTVQYYEEREGIISMLEDSLISKPKEILSYSGYEYLTEEIKDYLETYWKRRVKLKIPTRGIAPYTKELAKFCQKRNKKELRKVVMIPADKYKFINEIDIYADRVAIINLNPKNYMGVIIKSKDIAQTQKSTYELAWAGAKALYNIEY